MSPYRARNPTATVGFRARFISWRNAVPLTVLLSLTACQHQQQQESKDTAPPPPVVRHDIEPLAATFPALGAPVSASWISWDDARVGAESSALQLEWIDAVVQVTPATMNTLVTQHESKDVGQRPAVQQVLESALPSGPFRTGVELNMAFGAERRSTRVFLDPPRDTVVLQSSLAG